jgi:hypothetical protein
MIPYRVDFAEDKTENAGVPRTKACPLKRAAHDAEILMSKELCSNI